jgi:hypothetical protein
MLTPSLQRGVRVPETRNDHGLAATKPMPKPICGKLTDQVAILRHIPHKRHCAPVSDSRITRKQVSVWLTLIVEFHRVQEKRITVR